MVMAFPSPPFNDILTPVHPNRTPVKLHPNGHEMRLSSGPGSAMTLARPYPAAVNLIVNKADVKDEPPMAT